MNDTLITILSRKSVRNFSGKEVPMETLELLVKAGMSAPSAVDKRPWDFIILNKRPLLDTLADSLPFASMARQAPSALIVTGDTNRQFGGNREDYWICDCAAAVENILLAAESLNLGAVWTAVYPDSSRIDAVRSTLNIPDHIIPLAFIPVGYPAGETAIKDKYDVQRVHHNTW